jgi:hypothetical protein
VSLRRVTAAQLGRPRPFPTRRPRPRPRPTPPPPSFPGAILPFAVCGRRCGDRAVVLPLPHSLHVLDRAQRVLLMHFSDRYSPDMVQDAVAAALPPSVLAKVWLSLAGLRGGPGAHATAPPTPHAGDEGRPALAPPLPDAAAGDDAAGKA